jgi:DNA repair protein RadC
MHQGHRERTRKRFILHGLDGFEDHEILELMLFYAVPRKDTNEIAHRLVNTFGSIPAVFDAPINLLKEVEGVGESVAVFIKLIPELTRIYSEKKFSAANHSLELKNLCDKLCLKFIGRTEETVAIMLFDAKGKLIYDGIVSKGTVNAVDMYSRRIIELIVLYNACSLILAHNHPSGFAVPSKADIESTKHLSKVLHNMRVTLVDHIIVADNDYVSMRDCGFDAVFEGD